MPAAELKTSDSNDTMNEQIELVAELAAQRAIAKHEASNIERMRFFEQDLRTAIESAKADCKQYTDNSINFHEGRCPIGLEFKTCRAKLIGVSIGICLGSSGLTVALTKLFGL